MAFPQDGAPVFTQVLSPGSTTHNVTLPGTLVAGDLIIAAFHAVQVADNAITITGPGGSWVEIFNTTNTAGASSDQALCVIAKISDGTEAGGTVAFTTDATSWGNGLSVRVESWFGTIATGVAAGTALASGSLSALVFPALSPAWGSADTLWLAIGAGADDAENITVFSTSYVNTGQDVHGGANTGATLGFCSRENATASETPGNWTFDANAISIANTIAIRPAAVAAAFANPLALLGVGRAA